MGYSSASRGSLGRQPREGRLWKAGGLFANYFWTNLLVVFNRMKQHAKNEFLCLASGILVTWILVQRQGAMGAAWSLAAAETMLYLLTTISLWRGHAHRG